jgi:hypothetical protein
MASMIKRVHKPSQSKGWLGAAPLLNPETRYSPTEKKKLSPLPGQDQANVM